MNLWGGSEGVEESPENTPGAELQLAGSPQQGLLPSPKGCSRWPWTRLGR